MSLRRAIAALMPMLLLTPAAHAAMPETLDCTDSYHVNWRAEAPALFKSARDDEERGRVTIHLDPVAGEWFLSVEGSAALTQGGGDFTVVRPSTFEHYYEEWVGVDHDSMLRITGNGEVMRFVFVSNDYGALGGTCSEPEEPFVFLRNPAPPQ